MQYYIEIILELVKFWFLDNRETNDKGAKFKS